jgi:N6-L-threonylcarbamoyladenine synthase
MRMAAILGIESTCDETGAAVVIDGRDVRSNVVATQVELHEKFRGVVPEIASRAHIENILPVIREALDTAACGFADIDAIAVAHRPGLIGSLLVGVTAAKTLAWSVGKPLIGVDHVHAHLYSVALEKGVRTLFQDIAREKGVRTLFPGIGLVVSGGHTALYDVKSWTDVTLIGSTIDDAVGEAYDKVAAILGLGYPGGPIIDKLAQRGDERAIAFPRSLLGRDSLDFSFSGLKTAVLYHVRGVPGRVRGANEAPRSIEDIAASFQQACVDTIVEKLRRAVARTGAQCVIIGGGVSANSGLRAAMQTFSLPTFFPPMEYCTDNAAMSAGLAHVFYEAGQFSALDLDAVTNSALSRS